MQITVAIAVLVIYWYKLLYFVRVFVFMLMCWNKCMYSRHWVLSDCCSSFRMPFLTSHPARCRWRRRIFCRSLFTQTRSTILVSWVFCAVRIWIYTKNSPVTPFRGSSWKLSCILFVFLLLRLLKLSNCVRRPIRWKWLCKIGH